MKTMASAIGILAMALAQPIHAAKMQVCISSGGAITAKTKCKGADVPLDLGKLAARLTPAIAAAAASATNDQSSTNYAACVARNAGQQLKHDTAVMWLGIVKNHAIDIRVNMPIGTQRPVSAQTLATAQSAYRDAVQDIRARNLDDVQHLDSRADDYLKYAVSMYASGPEFQAIWKEVQSDLAEIGSMDISWLKPEACTQ